MPPARQLAVNNADGINITHLYKSPPHYFSNERWGCLQKWQQRNCVLFFSFSSSILTAMQTPGILCKFCQMAAALTLIECNAIYLIYTSLSRHTTHSLMARQERLPSFLGTRTAFSMKITSGIRRLYGVRALYKDRLVFCVGQDRLASTKFRLSVSSLLFSLEIQLTRRTFANPIHPVSRALLLFLNVYTYT